MKPGFDLDDIKFGIDEATFSRALEYYIEDRIEDFKEVPDFGFRAKIVGSNDEPYQVTIPKNDYDRGSCNCYLGTREVLCKHMIVLAIHTIKKGQKLTKKESKYISGAISSGKPGSLTIKEAKKVKANITQAMKLIKPYSGPAKTWMDNQIALSKGTGKLAKIVYKLPVGVDSAKILVNLLIRLERKLANGVDDSNGIVGNFITQTVEVLESYAHQDKKVISEFKKLKSKETSFGWEKPLIKMLAEDND